MVTPQGVESDYINIDLPELVVTPTSNNSGNTTNTEGNGLG